jgi:hypothetical protein
MVMTPSGSHPPVDDALWGLIEAFVEGTAAPDQVEQLQTRLGSDAASRHFYVSYLDLHAHLQWRMRGEAPRIGKRQPAVALDPALPAHRRRFLIPLSPLLAAAAAVLVVGLIVCFWLFRQGSEPEENTDVPVAPAGSVAMLIDNRDTVWADDMALPTHAGSPLPPGRLKLRSGVVEVAFHGGGEVLLEGPAEFDLSSSDRGFLHRGKLAMKVSAGAAPLHVGMPGVIVTDMAGECGLLQEDAGPAEIHVFEGQVGADPTNQQGLPMPALRVASSSGVRVDAQNQMITPVPLNFEAFARLRPEIRATGTTVRDGKFADENFSTAFRLMVKNSIPSYSWESFLRFDLSGVKGKVSKATVRIIPLRVGMPITNAVAFVPDNNWSETTLTWNTKPASGEAFAAWTAEMDKAVEFDVTGLVQDALMRDKLLSLRLFAPEVTRGNSFVQYGSRKGGYEARPELRLVMAP